jgi:hypothetical protein
MRGPFWLCWLGVRGLPCYQFAKGNADVKKVKFLAMVKMKHHKGEASEDREALITTRAKRVKTGKRLNTLHS